jgi:DNA-binding MarR family transcriptional regulator
MNKEEKKQKLSDFSEYVSSGIEEVGRDRNLDVQVTNIVKLRQGKMPQSMIVLQSFALELAYRKTYSVITFRVLNYFIALSQFENFVSIDIKTISDALEISEPSVKRATKQLVIDNIILKIAHPSDKRRIDYFLNPMAMWKGKTIKRDKFLNKAKNDKLQLDLFGKR